MDTVNNCVTTHQEVIDVIVSVVSHWTPTTATVQVREYRLLQCYVRDVCSQTSYNFVERFFVYNETINNDDEVTPAYNEDYYQSIDLVLL